MYDLNKFDVVAFFLLAMVAHLLSPILTLFPAFFYRLSLTFHLRFHFVKFSIDAICFYMYMCKCVRACRSHFSAERLLLFQPWILCLHFKFSTSQLILANLSNYTELNDMQNDRITTE